MQVEMQVERQVERRVETQVKRQGQCGVIVNSANLFVSASEPDFRPGLTLT